MLQARACGATRDEADDITACLLFAARRMDHPNVAAQRVPEASAE